MIASVGVKAPGGSLLPGGLAAIRRSTVFYPLTGLIVLGVVMTCASDTVPTGGIDLSVGAVMALSGTLMAALLAGGPLAGGLPGPLGVLACLGVGLAFGLANGAFIAYAKMPPIIVTLATMGVARGLALIYIGDSPISGLPNWMRFFGAGSILGVQTPIVVMAVLYLLAWVLLEWTPFGRYVHAIGGNETATPLSGVLNSGLNMVGAIPTCRRS